MFVVSSKGRLAPRRLLDLEKHVDGVLEIEPASSTKGSLAEYSLNIVMLVWSAYSWTQPPTTRKTSSVYGWSGSWSLLMTRRV